MFGGRERPNLAKAEAKARLAKDDTLVTKRALASTWVSCAVGDDKNEPRSVTGIQDGLFHHRPVYP